MMGVTQFMILPLSLESSFAKSSTVLGTLLCSNRTVINMIGSPLSGQTQYAGKRGLNTIGSPTQFFAFLLQESIFTSSPRCPLPQRGQYPSQISMVLGKSVTKSILHVTAFTSKTSSSLPHDEVNPFIAIVLSSLFCRQRFIV